MLNFTDIPTYLGWRFTDLQPGTFKRDKADFAHMDFPILSPRPTHGPDTRPLEECEKSGPFIYFVIDRSGAICYIGKTEEVERPLYRWIRRKLNEPKNEPESYYWTHATKSGGTVFNIADGIRQAKGPYTFRYAVHSELIHFFGQRDELSHHMNSNQSLEVIERILTREMTPLWDGGKKKRTN
ncbi:hypothetical protein [Rhodoferax sp. PAMC 29310]|uniref:hypothetical protein n=1 Tax=Rhodoferax sp. PAMC 29310 TaxID=2822760 RepID=UPI001B32F6CA|nr:hypothetical protein [Rhodoferax sp. PAMC 29310]